MDSSNQRTFFWNRKGNIEVKSLFPNMYVYELMIEAFRKKGRKKMSTQNKNLRKKKESMVNSSVVHVNLPNADEELAKICEAQEISYMR